MLCISLLLIFSQTQVQTAEEYYKNAQYEKALEEYNTLLDRGIRNPELYLNIGNCYYRLGDFGKSLLYYRRGWFLDPSNENIRQNLSLFKKAESNPNPFISLFSKIIDRISLRIFSYLLIISFSFLVAIVSILSLIHI